jgi:hypothetical protein
MDSSNFILLIMNCEKYRQKALYQKQTWLQNLPEKIKYYHVIGNETMDSEFNFDEENRILYVKTPDDYISLPKKVIASFKTLVETRQEIKYVFKTDDDQVVLNTNFFNVIINIINNKMSLNKDDKPHYGGYIVDMTGNYLSEYYKIHPELPKYLPMYKTRYCNGRFYFLSREAVLDLISKRERIEKEYFEDYAIGFYLDDIYKNHILQISTTKNFVDMNPSDYEYFKSS